jgi:CheY-like chemotaxis protein
MDVQTLESATTPFFTTKGIGKGTGLGLPMVQGLLAQSGGCLGLKSRKGEGTTAELWLPVAVATAEPVPVETIEPIVDVADRKVSVLAVDDDALVLMNTVIMLEDLGHSVVQAQSAEEALSMLGRGPLPDVLITDHAMPHMTGAELAQEVDLRYPDIEIIVASGYAELPQNPGKAVQRLQKPFSQKQLSDAVAAAAARGKGCFSSHQPRTCRPIFPRNRFPLVPAHCYRPGSAKKPKRQGKHENPLVAGAAGAAITASVPRCYRPSDAQKPGWRHHHQICRGCLWLI